MAGAEEMGLAHVSALSWLGMATEAQQLQRTLAFFGVWTGIAVVAEKWAPRSLADLDDRQRFAQRITALVHSASTCVLAFRILFSPEDAAVLAEDHMYGHSDAANLLFAHSCAFFLWDIWICTQMSRMDWGFMLHAIACTLCYLFGQFPYLHYYGVRFLLFELSTPFLNMMLVLRQVGRMGTVHNLMQNMFGYSFLAVRICYGFPLSYLFFQESLALLTEGTPHSVGVVVYYMAANCALNSLNLFWLVTMMNKRAKSS